MKTKQQKIASWVSLLSGALLLAIVAAGCKTSDMAMVQKESVKCPMCKMQTRTTAADGLVYAKHVCPGCHTVYNTGTSDEAAALTAVHVCDRCKATVEKCPMCAKK
jgi:hypothetical protein